jgi:hypothetical protein
LLCRRRSEPKSHVHIDHRVLLHSVGGIVQRANEPSDTWLLNQNESLTEKEASYDATFLEEYAWAFPEKRIPIQMENQYSISREANGNDTLCHRKTGDVLLFAPDHSFTQLVSLAGCPEYTLYRIPAASTFRDWVETVAAQWP